MYCRKCGAQSPDSAANCVLCGAHLVQQPPSASNTQKTTQMPAAPYAAPTPQYAPPRPYGPAPPRPENYLVWAILTTVFCCVPAGIVSIVYAAQVNGLYQAGNYLGAQSSSEKAKTWATVSAILVLLQISIGAAISLFTNGSGTAPH